MSIYVPILFILLINFVNNRILTELSVVSLPFVSVQLIDLYLQ
jgi:hypothetical protein